MSQRVLLVAGAAGLAAGLEKTGQFTSVYNAATTGGLKPLFSGPVRSVPTDEIVFLIADDLHCDTLNLSLEQLLAGLMKLNKKVIVLELTPKAKDLVGQFPSFGLLPGPYTVNAVLAAIRGITGWEMNPAPDGFATIDPRDPSTKPAPVGNWQEAPATPAPRTEVPAPKPAAAPTGGFPQWTGVSEPVAAPQADPFVKAAQANSATAVAPSPGPSAFPQITAPAFPSNPAGPAFPSRSGTPGHRAPLAPAVPSHGVTPNGQAFPTEYAQHRRQGKVIAIATPKGGVGKSTLSVNLAAYLGLRVRSGGRRVALVDGNFQQADIGKILRVYSPTLEDVAKDSSYQTPGQIQQFMVHRDDINVSILLGPMTPEASSPIWITPDLYRNVIRSLRELYDYIILDCPVAEPHHPLFQNFILKEADFLLVPVIPGNPTLLNAKSWLDYIARDEHQGGSKFPVERVGIVLNQAKDNVGMSVEDVRKSLPAWRFLGSIPYSDEWIRAMNDNTIVATRNFVELNNAFSQILYGATGDPLLANQTANLAPENTGLSGLFKKLGRRKK